MKYKLNSNGRGYIEDRQCVFCDLTQEVELPILLPENDYTGSELVVRIINGKRQQHDFKVGIVDNSALLKLPRYLLSVPQYLILSAHQVKNGLVISSWELEALKICDFGKQVELKRIVEPALFERIEEEMLKTVQSIDDYKKELTALKDNDKQRTEQLLIHQKQIQVLIETTQKMVRQIDLIENNYSIVETIGGVKNE